MTIGGRSPGIRTTTPLYKSLLRDADFVAGRLDIAMLDRKLEAGELRPEPADLADEEIPLAAIAAAIEHFTRVSHRGVTAFDDNGASSGRGGGWREQARRNGLRSGSWNW